MRRLVDPAAGGGQFLLAGITAEAEADGRAGLAVAKADGAEHMAWASRTAGTGRAQGEGDVAHVGDNAGTIQPVAAEVEVAVITIDQAAVDNPALSERCKRYFRQFLNM